MRDASQASRSFSKYTGNRDEYEPPAYTALEAVIAHHRLRWSDHAFNAQPSRMSRSASGSRPSETLG